MKKLILLAIVLGSAFIFSFTDKNENAAEITITVTANKPTKFDMFVSNNGVETKRLTTPYEFKVTSLNAKFIFKPVKSNNSIQMKAVKSDASVGSGGSVIVLLIRNDTMETLVME